MIGGLLWLAMAGAQDVKRDRPGDVMPVRHWDVEHLDLSLVLHPEESRLEGVSTHTLSPIGSRHQTLRLHQSALDIAEVTVDGQPTEWTTGRSWIDIPMPAEGASHTVIVRYSATPQTGLHFRNPRGSVDPVVEIWSQGENEDNRAWFPSWDFPNDKFTVTMHLDVPNGLTAIGNGIHTGTDTNGDRAVWHYELNRPIVNYLVALTVGEYAVAKEDGPVPLEYISAAGTPDDVLRRGLDKAAPQMVFFNDLLGTPYPYRIYRQVAVSRFMYGGMENSTLTILTDTSLVHEEGGRSRRTEELVAHELAHQWFGDLLTCYGWRELWLNEGFATYYTGRWLEHSQGMDAYDAKVDGWMRGARYTRTPMAPRGWSAVEGRDNEGVYVRGASVLHMLRVMQGDTTYDAAVADYTRDNADRLVETDDLRRAFEDRSGRHLGWFFDQYVHGSGLPSIDSRWSWADGQLTVTLTQTTETTPFEMPVEVAWADQQHTVWLGEGQTRVVFAAEASPDFVMVDPRHGVLANWTRHQEPQAWARQALEGATLHARLNAVRALADGADQPSAEAALTAVLRDPRAELRLRQTAAESLGELKSDAAGVALEQALRDPDPYLRESAVRALGALVPDERWADALLGVARSDSDVEVRGAALAAAANHDAKRATEAARTVLARPDRTPHKRAQELALRVLGDHAETRDLPLLLNRTRSSWPRGVRRSAAWAIAHLFETEDESWAEGVRERTDRALVSWLDDPDIRVRQGATTVLGQIGGDTAETALERFAATNEVISPDLSGIALDAASLIRMRGQSDADSPDPNEDMERLQQRLDALEERLTRMEEGH